MRDCLRGHPSSSHNPTCPRRSTPLPSEANRVAQDMWGGAQATPVLLGRRCASALVMLLVLLAARPALGLAAPGDLDQSFGQGGTASSDLGPHYERVAFTSAAPQNDGSVLATRERYNGLSRLTRRYLPNGNSTRAARASRGRTRRHADPRLVAPDHQRCWGRRVSDLPATTSGSLAERKSGRLDRFGSTPRFGRSAAARLHHRYRRDASIGHH